MSLFKQTARLAQQNCQIVKEINYLIEYYYQPMCDISNHFTIRDMVTEQDNTSEISQNEPIQKGRVRGSHPLIIVLINDGEKLIPGFFEATVGEHGRVKNKARGLNKRVTTDQLHAVSIDELKQRIKSSSQDRQENLGQLLHDYPQAAFYEYKPE